jgi:hypothetical protein
MNMKSSYQNSLPVASYKKDPEVYVAYWAENNRLEAMFKADLLDELGLTGHPKADMLFDIAWALGHAYGFEEVFNQASDLANLLK